MAGPDVRNMGHWKIFSGAYFKRKWVLGVLSAERLGPSRLQGFWICCYLNSLPVLLANNSQPTPICEYEVSRYNMLLLDGFLIYPATRFDGLN